jgi:hypothetical protein
MRKEFKEEKIGQVQQSVDSVSRLAELRNACNGRLEQIEKTARQDRLQL